MDLITPELLKAMDSLTKRYNEDGVNRWGKSFVSVDEVLPSTAWQLEVFQDFRKRLNESAERRRQRLIEEIRSELKKQGIKDKKEQVLYLYSVGLASQNIYKVVGLPKSTSDGYIVKHRREKGIAKGKEHNSTSFYDALVLIRNNMTWERDSTFRNSTSGYRQSYGQKKRKE